MFPLPNNPLDFTAYQWAFFVGVILLMVAVGAWMILDVRRLNHEVARKKRYVENAEVGRWWVTYGRADYIRALEIAAEHDSHLARLTLVGEHLRDACNALGLPGEFVRIPSFPENLAPLIVGVDIARPDNVLVFPSAKA